MLAEKRVYAIAKIEGPELGIYGFLNLADLLLGLSVVLTGLQSGWLCWSCRFALLSALTSFSSASIRLRSAASSSCTLVLHSLICLRSASSSRNTFSKAAGFAGRGTAAELGVESAAELSAA